MRLRRKPFLFALGTAALVAAGALMARAYAAACAAPAPYGFYASSYADTMVNPAMAEDYDFFSSAGGVPNIMILLDTSTPMNRLAPDGPHSYGTLPAAGTVGCGALASDGGLTGTMAANINARVYSNACGVSASGWLGQTYVGGNNYAHGGSFCQYWSNPNALTGKDGWDPDWYCGTGSSLSGASAVLTCSGQNKVNFFDRYIVVHDSEAMTGSYSSTTMTGDGWTYAGVFPHLSGGVPATAQQLCNDLKASGKMPATQGGVDTATICGQCLSTRGWFFDGRIDANVSVAGSPTAVSVPHLWYTGNYLNFYPPKFLVARKILKDTIMGFSKVRAAIGGFTNGGAQIAQGFNPDCAHPDSNFDSNRTTYMTTLDGLAITGDAPTSKALFDVGWYYHSTTLPWFSGTWPTHTVPASGQAPGGNANSYSVCYACQSSSVILVTGGTPTPAVESCAAGANPLPGGLPSSLADATAGTYAGATTTGIIPDCTTRAGGVSQTDCPECYAFTGADDYKNDLARVAWYMHNYDLRENTEATKDCSTNGGRQTIDFYAIGFGTTVGSDADRLLGNAAKVGGGLYVAASSPDAVRQSLGTMVQLISTRATSFSVANTSAVQSAVGHTAIVPSFQPSKKPLWDGHLSRYELYSEFVNGCIPGGTGDLDCDGTCNGVFLQDAAGHFIQEDGTGALKVNFPDAPSCSESKCTTDKCGVASGADATPWWDAGKLLAATAWSQRKVYTAVDFNGDGKIDASDTSPLCVSGKCPTFQLTATDAVADQLIPYMNLLGTGVCAQLGNDITVAGDTVTGALVQTDPTYRECAKEIIRAALGADTFNSLHLAAPYYPPMSGTTVNRDLLKDRAWKLGDVFHSSPVIVDPPAPADGLLCTRGLSKQCIPSLWNTPVLSAVPSGTSGTAYDGYSKSDLYRTRRKVVLVGANDGMLHAFNGGAWVTGDDPLTTGITELGYYERANSGQELWAFVPPDLISKLPLLVGQTHNLFVDGTPMVRDVWVDGSGNGLGSATNAPDDKKQANEFHTVAVVPERRGGVHHFALDVTDAFLLPSEAGFTPPKFLWIYPQPGSAKVLYAGETYADFSPLPPPIGPVRVEADGLTGTATPNVTPVNSSGVPYHERWVAFLSGGFDPQYVRGRGVHMVDVWTGKELFDFSQPSSCSSGSTDPRCALEYPVPATVAMVMWGAQPKNSLSFRNDGYFDTATFGDAGGQLWVLRFNAPAKVDANGLATNWFGARIFQMGARGAAQFCANEPFFYITSNVALTADGTYRVLAGTGDRYNLLDQYGGKCGPDNIRACVQRGCRVTLDAAYNRIGEGDKGDRQSGISELACAAPAFADSLGSYGTCNADAAAKVVIDSCPSYSSGAATISTKDMEVTCTPSGNGYGCTYKAGTTPAAGLPLALAEGANSITQNNKFFSIRVFDGTARRPMFATLADAITYDQNRLTETDLVGIDGSLATPTQLSDVLGNGYAITFNHAPSVAVGTTTYTVVQQDERVSSPSTIGANCAYFNTTQPATAAAGGACFVSNCTQAGRVYYLYGADVTTGGSCLFDSSGMYVRANASAGIAPPPAPQFTLFVNKQGQVQAGLTRVVPQSGAANQSLGGAVDPATVLESIDVPRDVHDCRHANPNGPSPNCR